MRLSQQLSRLAPALLAALLLFASLASTAHSHAASGASASAIAAGSQPAEGFAAIELDCALCAAATRLAHGAPSAPAPAPVLASRRFHAPAARDVAPQRVALARSEARAPPRLG